jgi:uncharacterized membrane protein
MLLALLVVVVVSPYVILGALSRFWPRGAASPARRGCAGLTLLFLMTGTAHFFKTADMVPMLPSWVPARTLIVLLSGVFELVLALGFLLPKYWRIAGGMAILFLIAVFPANVYAALHHIDVGGHGVGPVFLVTRVPVQLFLMGWIYQWALRAPGKDAKTL